MFSIIIPTYKRDEDLTECLESIQANTSQPVEVIVLHPNQSSTEELCKKYNVKSVFDEARKDGKRVKSLWAILNYGISLASNDFVLYLNDDCLVLPEWDKTAEKYFTNANLGLLILKTKGIGQDPEFKVQPNIYNFYCANYAIINRKAGILFDEHFDWYYGDADLPLQFAYKSKYKMVTTKENMIIHNHKIDESRIEHDSSPQNDKDFKYFNDKWAFFVRKGDRLRKQNIFEKIVRKLKW